MEVEATTSGDAVGTARPSWVRKRQDLLAAHCAHKDGRAFDLVGLGTATRCGGGGRSVGKTNPYPDDFGFDIPNSKRRWRSCGYTAKAMDPTMPER
mmetsp:Transcript_80133/g.223132  ORF Transcript_80133/g.223132 Transcript_80133/m.223132 type:complete len:96 (-) Transcript_80133:21-308(-)